MNMEIKVGTFYKTRSGLKARIYAVDGGLPYPVHGATCNSLGEWVLEQWTELGAVCTFERSVSGLDIISEWTEPKPKLKAWINTSKYVEFWPEWIIPSDCKRAEWLDEP